MPNPTVYVESIEATKALRMTWQKNVRKSDVSDAFQNIEKELQRRHEPLYVVVDITSNPNFPLFETINGALFGPYRDPLLKEWLVVGAGRMAQTIERVLAGSVGRDNVRWFTSEAEALAYLDRAAPLDARTG